MDYTVRYDAEAGLIHTEIQGVIDKPTLSKLVSEAGHIANEHNCHRILTDAREARSGLSTLEIYNLPNLMDEVLSETGNQVHKFRRALVVSSELDDFAFFETVSQNRSQNVRLFHDMDEARSWLFHK